jgi:uncharacterized membrane protein
MRNCSKWSRSIRSIIIFQLTPNTWIECWGLVSSSSIIIQLFIRPIICHWGYMLSQILGISLSLFSILSLSSLITLITMYYHLYYIYIIFKFIIIIFHIFIFIIFIIIFILLLKTNFIDFTSNNTHLEIVKSNPTTVLN